MGFLLALAAIVAGAWLIFNEKSLEGFGVFFGAAGVMIGSAIYKHRHAIKSGN